jgi:hypothetical protein
VSNGKSKLIAVAAEEVTVDSLAQKGRVVGSELYIFYFQRAIQYKGGGGTAVGKK